MSEELAIEEWRIEQEIYEFYEQGCLEDYLDNNYPGETFEEQYFEYIQELVDEIEYLSSVPENENFLISVLRS